MTWNEIVSAICIWLSAALFSLSLQGQTKLKILFVQFFATLLYLLNYLFVITSIPTAKIGAITASFEILRLFVFYFIEKSKKYNTKTWNLVAAIAFSIILTVCTILSSNSWYGIFPLVAAILVSLALGNKNVILIKIAFIIQAACIVTYLLLLGLVANAISQMIVFVFGIVGLITLILKTKKEKPVENSQN